ncbi:MAG: CDP-alcohol phosphatidyltransferase family protein [Tistlia sp.]|uniref:CDP-alcohol phosphatidyltransferase family protein n=1 Tax=Tistlia sp. TaxID=3057121 RepID=UPI0034A58069
MTEHSYSSPPPLGQAPSSRIALLCPWSGEGPDPTRARHRLLRSGLLSLAAAGLLLGLLGLWSSWALGLAPAIAVRALLLYAGLALLVLFGLPGHLPLTRFGPANAITLLRAAVACWLAALIGQDLPPGLAWLPAPVAGFALLLDGFDGWAARRGGWASAFGARFDLESDAFFLAVLAGLAVDQDRLGPWILLAGALRYLFVAAGRLGPWLRRPLAPCWSRKAAYVLTAGVLVGCLVPGVPAAVAEPAAAGALALLVASFLRDVATLRRTDPGDRP